MSQLNVFSDGGARGNPGPAGAGAAINDALGNTLAEVAQPLGTMTNNQAEYWAVVLILEKLTQLLADGYQAERVRYQMDSKLIVEQLNGNYKVKHPGLLPLYRRSKELALALPIPITFSHIPRHLNKQADALANQAMDIIEQGGSYTVPVIGSRA